MAAAIHPGIPELEAFTLGTLDDASLAGVEAHVANCPTCQEYAAAASGDTLVELLRRVYAQESASRTPIAAPASSETVALTHVARTVADGTEVVDVIPPELTRHERYRVLRLLGAGGMGAVYEAEHRVMQRAVAIKVINRAFTTNPAAVDRFRREVRAAARLTHPNIVTTYDAEDAADTLFLVMEYAEGTSLAHLVKERGPMAVAEACDCARQSALGLQHAHERGMVHRDIKPDNLIRCVDGTVKVLDFGLASLTAERGDDGLTGTNVIMGTPDYLAPEQAEDARTADARSDVYSLGCTLYTLLTGTVPYPASTALFKILAHREQPVPSLRSARPGVPEKLASVVGRMMAKKPADRYQTANAVAAALVPFAKPSQEDGADPAAVPVVGEAPRRPRHRLLVATLAAFFVCAAALAGAAVYRIQTDKGELVITTESDDVEVIVKQGGKIVRIVDTKSDKSITLNLRSGDYELELKGAPEGLRLDLDKATLKRDETVLAKIERVAERVTRGPPVKEVRSKWSVAELPQKPGLFRTLATRSAIGCWALSPDGRLVALPDDDNPTDMRFIRVYETATGRFLRDVDVSGEFPSYFAFLPNSKQLLLCSTGLRKTRWTFRIRDIETDADRRLTHIEPLEKWPTFELSGDGKRLRIDLVEPNHKIVENRVIDLETGRVLLSLELEEKALRPWNTTHLSADGKWLFHVQNFIDKPGGPYTKGRLRLYDLEEKLPPKDFDYDGLVSDPYISFEEGKFSALLALRGKAGVDNWIESWDIATGKSVGRAPYGEGLRINGCPLFQGRSVVSLDKNQRLVVFEMPSGKELFRSGPEPTFRALSVSRDGRVAAVRTENSLLFYRMPDPSLPKGKP